MQHILDDDFWEFFAEIPPNVQRRFPQKFRILQQNLRHPSLRLKKVGDLWSIRVSRGSEPFNCHESLLWEGFLTPIYVERRAHLSPQNRNAPYQNPI